MVTNLAASMGGLTWVRRIRGDFADLADAPRLAPRAQVERRRLLQRCHRRSGRHHARVGLRRCVVSSRYRADGPGSPAALAIGFLTSFGCNYGGQGVQRTLSLSFAATKLKFLLKFDDALDIFATHGVGASAQQT